MVRSKSAFVLAVALFAFGYYGSHAGAFIGVTAEDVWLPLSDGTQIHGRLYVPSEALSRPAPAVVIAHGYLGNAEVMERPFSVELARRGFVVLGVDYNGHGRSGGGTREFREGISPVERSESQPAVHAAIDYLTSRTDVDSHRLGVLGHSEGAKAVAHVAAVDRRLAATVYIAGPLDYYLLDPNHSPRNLLLLYGASDRLTPPHLSETERAVAGDWADHPGRMTGDFQAGSARRLTILKGNHFTLPFARAARREAISWFQSAMEISPIAKYTVARVPFLEVLIGCSGILLGARPLLKTLRDAMGPGRPNQDTPSAIRAIPQRERIAGMLSRAIICALAAGGTGYLVPAWEHAFSWSPVSSGATAFAALFGLATTLLASLVLVILCSSDRPAILRALRDSVVTRFGGQVAAGACLAAYLSAATTILLTGYYDLIPTVRRVVLMLASCAILIPVFMTWEAWHGVVIPGSRKWSPLAGSIKAITVLASASAFAVSVAAYFNGVKVVVLLLVVGAQALSLLFVSDDIEPQSIMSAATCSACVASWMISMALPFY